MNWYNFTKLSFPVIDTDIEYDQPGYGDIGHQFIDEVEDAKCKTFLWIWHDNSVKIEEITKENENITHNNFREYLGIGRQDRLSYEGRAEICEDYTNISLAVPHRLKYHSIPEEVINELYKQFGHDANIYSYFSVGF